MGLSGGSKTAQTNQTQTAQTATSQYQTAEQLSAQLQNQFGGQNVNQTGTQNQTQYGNQAQQQFGNQSQSYSDTTGASAFAQPYIQQALAAAQAGYNPEAGNAVGKTIQDLIPGLVAKYNGTGSAYDAPRSYITSTMNGDASNPQLAAMIAQTNASVGDRVNASIGTRGGAGGSAQAQLLARELAKNETGLRYSDYTQQQGRRDAAARSLGDLAGAETGAGAANLAALLSAAQSGVSIPQNSANSYASTIAQLLANATTRSGTSSGQNMGTSYGQTAGGSSGTTSSNTAGTSYGTTTGLSGGSTQGTMNGLSNVTGTMSGTTTEKNPGGFLDSLLQIGATLGSAALMSDRRLKQNITKVAELDDGLGVYDYSYLGSDTLRRGVMADEVATLRPWAIGPEIAGFKSVNYEMLEAA